MRSNRGMSCRVDLQWLEGERQRSPRPRFPVTFVASTRRISRGTPGISPTGCAGCAGGTPPDSECSFTLACTVSTGTMSGQWRRKAFRSLRTKCRPSSSNPNPTQLADWAKLARHAGQKYMVMTKNTMRALHIDTKLTNDGAQQGPGRDSAAEYVEARPRGRPARGVLLFPMDWYYPDGARCATDDAARERSRGVHVRPDPRTDDE